MIHLDTYIELLELLRDAKTIPTFTNIEQNIYHGLQDTPTLTELVVLALYAQAIGKPYMRHVRNAAYSAVDLGPFHRLVKQHCRAIIQAPEMLLTPDVSYTTGTLDGQPWDQPEVVYCALSLAGTGKLPQLRSILVAFFEGALKSWERFTTEFEVDGVIARATSEQRQSVRMSPTNDVSEGALGRCRQMLRRAPTMTDEQRNARVMWKHNKTHSWARETLTEADEAFVRQEARRIDACGSNRRVRMALNSTLEQKAQIGRVRRAKAQARKAATKARLSEMDSIEESTFEELSKMTVQQLDNYIDKLRETDKIIQPKSKLRNKSAKITEILTGLQRQKLAKESELDFGGANPSKITESAGMEEDLKEGDFPKDEDMYFEDEMLL